METWFIIIISLCISALIKPIFNLVFPPPTSNHKVKKKNLPPGPTTIPLIGNFIFLRRNFSEFESAIRSFRAKHGPIITLRVGSRPAIFIGTPAMAHQALVQNGAVFSDRPEALATVKVISSNQHSINSAGYGPTWRLLRRNLTSEILHPSRVKSYSAARQWVLEILFERLVGSQSAAEGFRLVDHFQYAMFCLLVLMCFGDKLDEKQIRDVERVQRQMLVNSSRFDILNVWPMLGKIVFHNRWKELLQLRQSQEDVLIPLIRSRREVVKRRQQGKTESDKESVVAYVDTLLDLELPDEKRKLDEKEMVTLCSEFLDAGTDTTFTALQWIMANLVKYPHVQTKVYEEIHGIVGPSPQLGEKNKNMVMIKEEDLQRMPYLKSVVLEGLRRHPPGHLVLPHAVTKDVEFEGYLVPKGAIVNFMVADIGWDPNVWDEPMEFKPERFFTNTISGGNGVPDLFDITGSKEIKMMPFGVGRRICPAAGMAILHLEFFIANLVWYFEWTAVEGDTVDLSEKQEFTIVMKYPLRAHISPRGLSATQ
ncbi:cytochrome P450 89A2-like [Rhododendron vialii]|uniref:cytochrome P450 89A2-like n=1 Tax=Rhododendron vialii TaxID=182163 RepID=UPI00265DCAFD|nr:cytochrome P450 89A2-like [Rhododendron vialii]